jgi:hypothetical protein
MPDKKPNPNKVILTEPKEGESKKEFTKRVIKLFRERGLITDNKNGEQARGVATRIKN